MFHPILAQGPAPTRRRQLLLLAIIAVIGFFIIAEPDRVVLLAKYFNLWIQAKFSEAKVT